MITGSVNSRREAIIQLEVLGHDGQRQAVDAVIDTGFNGFLTLPGQVIAALGLRRFGSVRVVLVDGSEDLFPTYKATVSGTVRAQHRGRCHRQRSFAGMALFARHELRIKVVYGRQRDNRSDAVSPGEKLLSMSPHELESAILDIVNQPGYQPVKPRVIAKRLGEEASEVRRAVKRLVRQGKLDYGASHLVRPASSPPSATLPDSGEASFAPRRPLPTMAVLPLSSRPMPP